MVVERKRPEGVEDQFVVYCEECENKVLHAQFVLTDIVGQLKPLLGNFWASEEQRTCNKCEAVVQPVN